MLCNTVQCSSEGNDLSHKHTDWFAVLPSCIITLILCRLENTCCNVSSRLKLLLMDLVS